MLQLCLNPVYNSHRLLMCSPKSKIRFFESGKESDFASLKMALDNLLNCHLHLNEQYSYQVLLGHLKLQSVLQLAKACMHNPRPYTAAMQALQDTYGQPRQLVRSELGAILNTPALKFGDSEACDAFAFSNQSLVYCMMQSSKSRGMCSWWLLRPQKCTCIDQKDPPRWCWRLWKSYSIIKTKYRRPMQYQTMARNEKIILLRAVQHLNLTA